MRTHYTRLNESMYVYGFQFSILFNILYDFVLAGLLLAGLPPEYKPMVMAISSSGVAIKGDLIKSKLLQEVEEPLVSTAFVL